MDAKESFILLSGVDERLSVVLTPPSNNCFVFLSSRFFLDKEELT